VIDEFVPVDRRIMDLWELLANEMDIVKLLAIEVDHCP
jgi:hypothetical protein